MKNALTLALPPVFISNSCTEKSIFIRKNMWSPCGVWDGLGGDQPLLRSFVAGGSDSDKVDNGLFVSRSCSEPSFVDFLPLCRRCSLSLD